MLLIEMDVCDGAVGKGRMRGPAQAQEPNVDNARR